MRRLRDDAGMYRALLPVVDEQNEFTVGAIKQNRLNFPKHGPTVDTGLRHQSGRLFKSIRASKAVVFGNSVRSGIGSNVKYLGAHEFGFDGEVQVPAHMRERHVRQVIFGRRKKVRTGDIAVRGHKRHLRLKERAPIRRELAARADKYAEAVVGSIVKFYAGK